MENNFAKKLIEWYKINLRDLPWRKTKDPYKIWVSEIILQQTRINQGTPYYLNFINQFPNVKKLSKSTLDEIMKVCQGIGYYSRIVNMHKCAKIVVSKYNSNFPTKYCELINLPGIGDYTASAISSICSGESKMVVDGNVIRLFSRLYNLKYQQHSSMMKKTIKKIGEKEILKFKSGDFNQALMDYGSMICTPKKYKCDKCIFSKSCEAFRLDIVDELPVKKKNIKISQRFFNYFVVIDKSSKVKIHKRKEKDIWNNLYEFELLESNNKISVKEAKSYLDEKHHRVSFKKKYWLSHKLTHQFLSIDFWIFEVDEVFKYGIDIPSLNNYPFPKPIFSIISKIQ
ncbi:MAG: A/G-specific adenine glycosylase [Bacteroidota bacterium]|nr:A/G-specific adenine glycosylase [Bacteroidota bacterium]